MVMSARRGSRRGAAVLARPGSTIAKSCRLRSTFQTPSRASVYRQCCAHPPPPAELTSTAECEIDDGNARHQPRGEGDRPQREHSILPYMIAHRWNLFGIIDRGMDNAGISTVGDLYVRVKKPYKKSRHGCMTCRRRRVKCDERTPHCKACVARGLECTYWGSEKSSPKSSPHLEIVSFGPDPWSAANDRSPSPATRSMYSQVPDGLLFQYYLCHVSGTLATTAKRSVTDLWYTAIPAIAFTHPGASHAIMALSALCMGSDHHSGNSTFMAASLDFERTAELHYTVALADLRACIEAPEHSSVDAVLACCIALVPCGLARARRPTADNLIGDWLFHMRGLWTLAEALSASSRPAASHQRIVPWPQHHNPGLDHQATELADQLVRPTDSSVVQAIHRNRYEVVERLQRLVTRLEAQTPPDDLQVYLEAISRLGVLYEYITEGAVGNYTRAVFHWAVMSSSRFVQLLADQDGTALTVFAHWLVAMIAEENSWWWLVGFGSSRIRLIADILEKARSPYCDLLNWPMEMVEHWGT